jgi:dolichyl-phosphate-mannose--protein O-mannosyl transferase
MISWVQELGYSTYGAVLAGSMVLFEGLYVTQSRLILLDAMLQFFTAMTVYSYVVFCTFCLRIVQHCERETNIRVG